MAMRAALLVIALPSLAQAEPVFVPDRAVVVGRVGDGAWSDAPTEARTDQKAELAAVVSGHRGSKRVVMAPAGVTAVKIAGSRLAAEPLDGAKLQWSAVEPHGFRANPSKVGATSDF